MNFAFMVSPLGQAIVITIALALAIHAGWSIHIDKQKYPKMFKEAKAVRMQRDLAEISIFSLAIIFIVTYIS